MLDDRTAERADAVFDSELESPVSQVQCSYEQDWTKTIQNLLELATEANNVFDFDRALHYLSVLEEIWDFKGLPGFSLEKRFAVHREKGKAYASRGKHEKAIEEYQKILRYCCDSSHLTVKSETFTQIGQLLAKQGDHDRALGYLQRATGAYRRLKDRNGLCKALRNLGVVYVELGEFEEAESYLNEAIRVAREIEDQVVYADLINNLGAIMNMRGNWRRALKLYRESLQIYESQDEIRKSAYTKNNVAITLAEQGMNDEAFEYYEQAYQTAKEISDASLVLIVDINLADLYLKTGNLSRARLHCERAQRHLIESNRTNGHLVETKKIAGKIAYHEKDHDRAQRSFSEALDLCREIGARFLEAEVLLERGTLYRAMDRHLDSLSDLESSYQIYKGLKAEGKREQAEDIIDSIEKLYLELFESMGIQVDRKDKYTKGHSDRVASFALLLARELGLKTSVLKTIVAAALLHDLGKIKMDDSVLKKAGRLTDEEYRLVKKHPELSVELLHGKELPWDIKPLILGHHEKMNGEGYPLGLKGEDIPLGARIICVADVFDALTSDRVYRPAFDPGTALDIMEKESGTSFDPMILGCFIQMVRRGKADLVINSRTREDEMYSIWSQCMLEQQGEAEVAQEALPG